MQSPQKKQPDKAREKRPLIEKQDAPEEIDDELQTVQGQRPTFVLFRGVDVVDHGAADTHEGIENGPNDGEHDAGRGESGPYDAFVKIHAVPCQIGGQEPHRQGDQDPYDV